MLRHLTRRLAPLTLALALVACDDDGGGTDAGMDSGGGGGDCTGMADGAACGEELICVSESCVASECGDGIVDDRTEECDDGNMEAFDGCEPSTCEPTCTEDAMCNDGLTCNGTEVCQDNVCAAGTNADDGTACTRMMEMGICREGACVEGGCGNGVVEAGEMCDDGNDDEDDGCTSACEPTCVDDTPCDDGDMCNGAETCDLATNTCMAGTMLVCDDGSPCTTDSCDSVLGCVATLIDADMDGFAPDTLGACGTDCDDTRDDTFPGAEELCDGRDNNCVGGIDEVSPTWYVDCDADGYAANTDSSRTACAMPAPALSGCTPGGWTTIRPIDVSTTDCNDTDPAFNPGVAELPGDEVDQNCDGTEICFLDQDNDGFRRPSGSTITSTDTDCTDTREATRSAPDTDCCDRDARAFPGQTAFFDSPRGSCGGYDYNCDTMQEQQYTLTNGRCTGIPTCATQDGWVPSTAAPCGMTGPYFGSPSPSVCARVSLMCIQAPGSLTQACR